LIINKNPALPGFFMVLLRSFFPLFPDIAIGFATTATLAAIILARLKTDFHATVLCLSALIPAALRPVISAIIDGRNHIVAPCELLLGLV
jgi:hypothetical protein